MEFLVRLQKTAEITYLEAKKAKKVSPNIFRALEGKKKVRFMFLMKKSSMKSKCYIFSSYKQRNKVCLVYLECKLQPDRSC